MMADTYATAREMLRALAAKDISARELLDAHLARNDGLHTKLNAVIETDIARAKKDAQAIDDARARGKPLGPLAGIPMTIKDGFDVENMPAVCGNPALVGRAKTCPDAAVVARARKAGAVIWGKTNVPLMLGDLQSFNEIYGTTNNPYDVTRTPGGSSGGSATALAAGITPLEIGSDIGGSLRHPANYCGVYSLKPTWNALPQAGHIPPLPDNWFEPDLNVVGPMARNAEDLRLLYGVLHDSAARPRRDVKGARVALWNAEPNWPLSAEVKAATVRVAKALGDCGVEVVEAKPAIDGEEMMRNYMVRIGAEMSANLPDAAFAEFLAGAEADKRAFAEHPDWTSAASYRLSATALYRDVTRTLVARHRMKEQLTAFYASGFDAILMPITPVPAFRHSQSESFMDRHIEIEGRTWPFLTMVNWISLATFLHAPAIAVPAGRTGDGLPVGVQLVGTWNGEDRLFDFAAALEETLGGFTKPAL
jgi:amidase